MKTKAFKVDREVLCQQHGLKNYTCTPSMHMLKQSNLLYPKCKYVMTDPPPEDCARTPPLESRGLFMYDYKMSFHLNEKFVWS